MIKKLFKFNPCKIYLLIALTATLSYLHGINGEFVLDDIALISEDPFYQSEDSSFTDCWKRTYWQGLPSLGQYRPMAGFTYLLNARLSGMNSPMFRLTNLLIHIAVSILVFILAGQLGSGGISAILAALLYAVHPIHTEAVIPSSGRAELLCALFILIGMVSFIRILKTTHVKPWMYLIPSISLVFAMWSKENGIILIPLCLLYELLYKKLSLKKLFCEKDTFLRAGKNYIGFIIGFIIIIVSKLINVGYLIPFTEGRVAVEVDNPLVEASLLERWCTAIKIQGMVFFKYLWPEHLSHDYSFAEIVPVGNLFNWYAWLAIFMIFVVPVVLYILLPGFRRIIIFLSAAYIISILPAGNFLVTTGTIFGERLYYTPSIFFLICAVFALVRISQKITKMQNSKRPVVAYAVCIVLLLAVFAGGWRSYTRSLDWHNQTTLTLKGIETAPRSTKTWANVAVELARDDQLEPAVEACNKALSIFKYSRNIQRNKVSYLIRLKRYPEAEICLRELVRQRTEFAKDFNNLSWLMQLKGNFEEAAKLLEHSLKMDPDQPEIRKGLEAMKNKEKIDE